MDKWQKTKNQTGIKYKFNVHDNKLIYWKQHKTSYIWLPKLRTEKYSVKTEEEDYTNRHLLWYLLTCFKPRLSFTLLIMFWLCLISNDAKMIDLLFLGYSLCQRAPTNWFSGPLKFCNFDMPGNFKRLGQTSQERSNLNFSKMHNSNKIGTRT